MVRPGTNTRKQELRYSGPYRIAKVISRSVMELEGLPPQVPKLLNVEYLRPYRRYLEAEAFRARRVPPKVEDGKDAR